jgi:hypothetical protein
MAAITRLVAFVTREVFVPVGTEAVVALVLALALVAHQAIWCIDFVGVTDCAVVA